MGLSKEQLREIQEIVEQWRRPSLRTAEWFTDGSEGNSELVPPRPTTSDVKLHRLERTLVHSNYRDTATPPDGDDS